MGAQHSTSRLNRLSHGGNMPRAPKPGTATAPGQHHGDKTPQLLLNRNKAESLRMQFHNHGYVPAPLTPLPRGASRNPEIQGEDPEASAESGIEAVPALAIPLPKVEEPKVEGLQLSDMPVDILCRILAHVPRHSWAAARGVCTLWRDAVGTPEVLWQRREVGLKDPWAILVEWVFGNPKDKKGILWAFDPSDKHMYRMGWVPDMEGVNHQSQMVAIGPYAIFLGGTTCVTKDDGSMDIVPSHAAWSYHLQTGRLRQMPNMLEGRVNFATAVVNGKLIVAGGTGANDTALSSVEEFDPKTSEWSRLADLTCARGKCFGGENNGQFFVFSQGAEWYPEKYADVYNPNAKTWSLDRKVTPCNFMPKAPNRFNLVGGCKVELTPDLGPNNGCGNLDGHKNNLSLGNQISWCTSVM